MWILITISCATLLSCDYAQIDKKVFMSLAECEQEMKKRFPDLESGQGVMCYKREDIQT